MAITLQDIPDPFYLEVAIGVNTFEEVCDNYGLSPADVEALETDPMFGRRLRQAKTSVEEDGRAFRARCRNIVSNNLITVEGLMRDPDTSPSVQLEAFKTLVKYGELEPRAVETQGSGGPSLTLTIVAPGGNVGFQANLGGQAPVEKLVTPPKKSLPSPEPYLTDMDEVTMAPVSLSALFGAE